MNHLDVVFGACGQSEVSAGRQYMIKSECDWQTFKWRDGMPIEFLRFTLYSENPAELETDCRDGAGSETCYQPPVVLCSIIPDPEYQTKALSL